ncbi:acyl-CoA wax alcohol acyltransferase 1-like [Sycon ciliatum]|uniref:acyl-CoA wax alcohol acyltransferase 1-like n=1 Tax=Sycon ciliatum TaxID=27933 RepID=UPI0020A93A10|eukprot:scpid77317/ scgid29048/ Diacylglycerol O-acyltransferase 2; Diglyceride acyltransferase 2
MWSSIRALLSLAWQEHFKRATVTLFILCFFCGHVVPTGVLLVLLVTPLAPIVVIYFSWILVFDWKSPSMSWLWPVSVRRSNYLRNARFFHFFRDFFPVKLVKTAELDPSRNYVFAYHPHGVFAVGVFANFATEATGFSATFPGITVWPMTVPIVFSAPVLREWLMLLGARSVTTSGCRGILASGPGNAVAIVPGGTREILEARPKESKLAIRKRKGFIRIALETGSPVVPVYGFGENDLFDQPKSKYILSFQRYCTERFGLSLPFFQGNELARMLPHRRPVTTVVGEPMVVPQVEKPTAEIVDHWHAMYLEKLSNLFDMHKEKYGYEPEKKLEFI